MFVGAMRRKPTKYYRTFIIRKGTKKRQIMAPRVALKVIQTWIACYLSTAIKSHDAVYGFIPGRSSVLAAKVHCGAAWVYSLDIENFFPSTPATKVKEALNSIGYSDHASGLISDLCCYAGFLSQGSPASPVLSNLVFRNIDIELGRIAESFGCRFTRYADDIVFSGHGATPDGLCERVRNILTSSGWRIAAQKERLSKLPHRLKVHGLLVHGQNPRLTKGYRNRIRAIEHLLNTKNVPPSDAQVFRGHLAYAKCVSNAATT
jgi:retron-type reverse transcriptase